MTGYHQQPCLSAESVGFVCEDALWIAARSGGPARRLTARAEVVRLPCFSPDGSWVAYTSTVEGEPQVYRVPVGGGEPERLTDEPGGCELLTVRSTGATLVRSLREAHLRHEWGVLEIAAPGVSAPPRRLDLDRVLWMDLDESLGHAVLGLNLVNAAAWKRYRGGMVGEVWLADWDGTEASNPRKLFANDANRVTPALLGDRVFYLSDEDGNGNLYSSALDGSDVRRLTDFRDYYARNLRRFGDSFAFQKGARLFECDAAGKVREIEVRTHGTGVQRARRFADAEDELQQLAFSGDGRHLALTVRGKALVGRAWGGAVRQLGERHGVRYRLPVFLPVLSGECKEMLVVSDEGGEELLERYRLEDGVRTARWQLKTLCRLAEIVPSPDASCVALADVRGGLSLLDLSVDDATGDEAGVVPREICRSRVGEIHDIAFSPDARFLAWVVPVHWLLAGGLLHLRDLDGDKEVILNDADLPTHAPAFDPKGRFLYALSERTFDPVLGQTHFGAACIDQTRLYAWVLAADGLSPFDPRWSDRELDREKAEQKRKDAEGDEDDDDKPPPPVHLDFDGLEQRIVVFPDLLPGVYSGLRAYDDGVCYLSAPVVGLRAQEFAGEPAEETLPTLCAYDLKERKETEVQDHVTEFWLAGKRTLMQTKDGLRLLKTGEEPPEEPGRPGKNRHTGWIELERFKVEVEPAREWGQMYQEAWRMQRDFFWSERMAGIDWEAARQRYLPLVERVTTRSELSDVIWELQGELGTSHAYERGGDHPLTHEYKIGGLGADFSFDGSTWQVARVLRGDAWDPLASSPLARPGALVPEGAELLSLDGRELSATLSPQRALVDRAGERVDLLVRKDGIERHVVADVLSSERELRYRDWVRSNRALVFDRSEGRLGYMHLPDMSGDGLGEFLRAWRTESKHLGLIVDVRGNGGGFVSELVIGALRALVIGWTRPRWMTPESYPSDAVRGPIVAVCDQFAGSDGDIFCHAFREFGLGKLVGKRTWGGVVGIELHDLLADGTLVTQPEFATHFNKLGWGLENRGVEPDIEVDPGPLRAGSGEDPQLTRAIGVALEQLADGPSLEPEFEPEPDLG